jgi:hypothetical protein
MRKLLATCIFLTLLLSAAASASTIKAVTIAGTQLTIMGTGFTGIPLTVTFNGARIPIVSSSATTIVATLSPIPAPGTYRLVVKAGTVSTFSYATISAPPAVYTADGTQQPSAHVVFGTVTTDPSTGRVAVTLSGSAQFTSQSSYVCTAVYAEIAQFVVAPSVANTDGSSFTIGGVIGQGTGQPVSYICVGD